MSKSSPDDIAVFFKYASSRIEYIEAIDGALVKDAGAIGRGIAWGATKLGSGLARAGGWLYNKGAGLYSSGADSIARTGNKAVQESARIAAEATKPAVSAGRLLTAGGVIGAGGGYFGGRIAEDGASYQRGREDAMSDAQAYAKYVLEDDRRKRRAQTGTIGGAAQNVIQNPNSGQPYDSKNNEQLNAQANEWVRRTLQAQRQPAK